MNLAQISKLILPFVFTIYAALANSAVIYPIDNAAILTGAKFDIKIELNNINSPEDIVVELNGKPISKMSKVKPEFISNEGGKGSSLLYRDVQLSKSGKYLLRGAGISEIISSSVVIIL
jgi:alkaline phosphatase